MSVTCWTRFETIALAKGNALAVVHGSDQMTFAELLDNARDWARLDVQPGGRVILCVDNCIAAIAAVAGIWRRGAIPVWVHSAAPVSHLEQAVAKTKARLILTDGAVYGNCPSHGLAPPALGKLPSLPRQSDAEPASILFTSGATGPPKGVVQSANNLLSGAERVAAALGYTDTDSILCPIPFAFDYGWGQLLSLLLAGVPLVLPAPRNAFGLTEALSAHRPTVLAGVPAIFADLLSGLSPIREVDRTSIRLITNTGSRIPSTIWKELLELFPDSEVSLNYGLTETYRSALLPVRLAREMPDSVGYPLPGVDIAVIRQDGTRALPNEEGEIIHRGAGVALGYWGEPELTAQTMRPDPLWSHPDTARPNVVYTGDIGHLDEAGRLFIHGRRDRQLKSMGVRVSPDEIEELILQSGLIEATAVTSSPHEIIGDQICALIVLKAESDENETLKSLKRYARKTMSPYMQPRVWWVLDSLPRNPSGKVDYVRLKKMVSEPS
ncbi:MAG: class I adenylate-forming enzyme family protein [Paracoccaceae bacterium]